MAIWQFRLILLPEDELGELYPILPKSIPEEIAEDRVWWSSRQPQTGFEAQIDAILPPMESWSQSMRMWGQHDGNDAYVIYADEDLAKVEQISFRIDARNISPDLVHEICTLAKRMGCVFVTHKYEILLPSETDVLNAIESSTAKSFVDDPITTLKNLDTTKIEISLYPHEES
jgi:hypothetical protein